MTRSAAKKRLPTIVSHPWSDRPGASMLCWNGNNLQAGTTVHKPGPPESPATGDAADYAYGRSIGKECARDYLRAFVDVEPGDDDLSETVCNLMQDPTRSEIVKRGALAGFLDELAIYTHRGIEEVHSISKDSGRNCLALLATRGFIRRQGRSRCSRGKLCGVRRSEDEHDTLIGQSCVGMGFQVSPRL